MKKHKLLMSFSVIAAMLFVSLHCMPAPAISASTPTIQISQVEIPTDSLAEQKTVSVDVTITDNEDGFLATSFGILYHTDLTLSEVTADNDAGQCHVCSSNPELGMLWFSGACGTADGAANIGTTETMFTLTFTLPDNAGAGSDYPIFFTWDAADDSQAYWYTESHANIIGDIKSKAINGGIKIPDPDAPRLSESVLELSTNDSAPLSVLNYEGNVTWFSDNVQIADVKNGIVSAFAAGSCTVYALMENSILSCTVLVSEEANYDISKTEVIYIRDVDKVVNLKCPTGTSIVPVIWVSDNTSVVTVNNGLLTAQQNGAATIYAISGSKIYQVFVIVELQTPSVLSGDINLDGSVDILDVVLLNRSILGASTLDKTQKTAADIYHDGKISSMDTLYILKFVVNLLPSIPVEP